MKEKGGSNYQKGEDSNDVDLFVIEKRIVMFLIIELLLDYGRCSFLLSSCWFWVYLDVDDFDSPSSFQSTF